MDLRDQFLLISAQRQALVIRRAVYLDEGHDFARAYARERRVACERLQEPVTPARRRSKRAKSTEPCGVCGGCAAIHAAWTAAAGMVWGTYTTQIKHRERQLRDLCVAGLRPEAGERELVIEQISSSSYASQGFGAEHYARQAAECVADKARLHEIPVEVRTAEQSRFAGWRSEGVVTTYGVYVRVRDELDLEILNYSDAPSLVEQVRLCWARGVNPRVFNPYLPHGFEAKHGLDYFGGRRQEASR